MNESDTFADNLFGSYYDVLIQKARRHTSDWALAEDMVQSTLETALDNIEKVKAAPSVKGWLFRTLKYKFNRELDKVYRKYEVMTEDEYITELLKSDPADSKPLTLAGLDEIIPASCPPQFRRILCLRYVERLQYNEIAEELGIKLGATQQRLLAAQHWLQDYFERHSMPYGS